MAERRCAICGGQLPVGPDGSAVCASCGRGYTAAWVRAEETGDRARLRAIRDRLAPARGRIAAGGGKTVGVRADGTVLAAGTERIDLADWTDIVAVAADRDQLLALRPDGSLAGRTEGGQRYVSAWSKLVAIARCGHTVGLRADGTVAAVGPNLHGQCGVSDWSDIVAVAAGDQHTVGVRSNGTVLAVGADDAGQCRVSAWSDVVEAAAGAEHTVGLRADGTVLAAGGNRFGQCEVAGWTDVVAVAARGYHTFGLRADGTVLAAGDDRYGGRAVTDWRNIAALAAGEEHVVGLRSDGTVLAAGNHTGGACDVAGWRLFFDLDTLASSRRELRERSRAEREEDRTRRAWMSAEAARFGRERKEAADRAERERRRDQLTRERAALRNELANVKGVFAARRSAEIEARLLQIEKELQAL